MTTAIVPNSTNSNNSISTLPAEWQMLQQQAAALVASGFLPQAVNSPQKAVAIMMLGKELGIAPWAALTTINVIQGKPTVSPQLMLALINRSGQLEDIKIQDEGGTVHVGMKRKGRSEHWESFGQADAEKMNLWQKPNWKSQPATMMKWRAVAACARVVFADVILGLYTPEEMGAEVLADEQGNMTVIDVKPEPVRHDPPQEQLPASSHPATVKGAGITAEKPTSEPDPLDWTDEDPRLYHCDALKVFLNKTAAQYVLCVKGSQSRIVVTDMNLLGSLSIGTAKIPELKAGDYPLMPMWSVYADKLPNGAWEVTDIQTGIGEPEGV